MLKKLAMAVLVLIILIGGGLYFLNANLDNLVKSAVEKYGTAATQAQTTLQNVKIVLSTGEGELDGFKLGNPAGYTTDSAIKAGKIAVKIDKQALMGQGPIVIDEVLIDGPEVTFEVGADGKNNLQAIQKNVNAYAEKLMGAKNQAAAPAASQPSAPPKEGRKIIIRSLDVKGGIVRLSHQLLKGKNVEAKLPPIHLTNVGEATGGATAAQIGETVLNVITTKAIDVGSDTLVKQLRDQGVESLKGAVEQSPIGKNIGNAVKGLFGN